VTDTVKVEPGTFDTATARCEEGDLVLHGGCQWGSFSLDGGQMGSVIPYFTLPNGATFPDTWQCQGQSVVEHWTEIVAMATCLEVDR
jgi:hypothetical protein